jgi:hypothetical protein
LKKYTILFGSIFSILLLVQIPNISAVEYSIIESTIEEKSNNSFFENFDGSLYLSEIGNVFKKIITIFLFIIDFILIFGSIFVDLILNDIFEIFINEIIDVIPFLSFLLVLLSMFIDFDMPIKPAMFVLEIILKIEAWGSEQLWRIHRFLVIIAYVLFFSMEKIGIIDFFQNPKDD